MREEGEIFHQRFLSTLENLVTHHHTIYPRLPPQGIFLETLIEGACHLSGAADARIVRTGANAPYDLHVADQRVSIKSETGRGTHPNLITITKLCTTEREPWDPGQLVLRAMGHLDRYDRMVMLRAIWQETFLRYQFVEIPLGLLRLMARANLMPVGRRRGRQSLAGDMVDGGEVLCRVFFDGADGKCQIRNLRLERCEVLREWNQRI